MKMSESSISSLSISNLQLSSGGFYLYGAGHYARALLKTMRERGLFPRAVIDRKPPFKRIQGIPVLALSKNLNNDLPILITILGYPNVVASLRDKNFTQIIDAEAVFDLFPSSFRYFTVDKFLWRQPPRENQLDPGQVEQVRHLLSDEKSRRVLENLVKFRSEPTASSYPWPDKHEMCFPDDIEHLYGEDRLLVVDCGAYNGDTLRGFYERYEDKIVSYLALEPNRANALSLKSGLEERGGAVSVLEVGVGEDNSTAWIDSAGSASAVREKHEEQNDGDFEAIKIVRVDDLVAGCDYNVLKMDIEGHELKALHGAREFICERHPTLVISVYHTPEHLWEIPLWVHEIAGDAYHYYLRLEGHWGLETTLYCTPKQKRRRDL